MRRATDIACTRIFGKEQHVRVARGKEPAVV
jgi:hypothetical protein